MRPAPTLPVITPAGASSATASARRGFFMPRIVCLLGLPLPMRNATRKADVPPTLRFAMAAGWLRPCASEYDR